MLTILSHFNIIYNPGVKLVKYLKVLIRSLLPLGFFLILFYAYITLKIAKCDGIEFTLQEYRILGHQYITGFIQCLLNPHDANAAALVLKSTTSWNLNVELIMHRHGLSYNDFIIKIQNMPHIYKEIQNMEFNMLHLQKLAIKSIPVKNNYFSLQWAGKTFFGL